MNKPSAFTIRIVTTDYDGTDFPEADQFPQFVAGALAQMHPSASIDVEGGAPSTLVTVWNAPDGNEADLTREISEWVRTEAWEDFTNSIA